MLVLMEDQTRSAADPGQKDLGISLTQAPSTPPIESTSFQKAIYPEPRSSSSPAGTALEPATKRSRMKIVIVCLILVAIGVGGVLYLLKQHRNDSATSKTAASTTYKGNVPADIITGRDPYHSGAFTVPFGRTASDGVFQIKLLGVIRNPKVTGDQPKPGYEYLEADFSITNLPKRDITDYFLMYDSSIVPDKLKARVDSIRSVAVDDSKTQVPGKISINFRKISGTDLAAGSGAVNRYALFEVQVGDKGKIFWRARDNNDYNYDYQ
jgi:hypothetical protein